MSASNLAPDALLKDFPYQVHQIQGPSGELVWVERGVNPDNIFGDKRKSDWPYSVFMADMICDQIVNGAALTKICKTQGYPPYSVVCRWRMEQDEFNKMLEQAYKDRAELYREQILDLIEEIDSGGSRRQLRLKFQALKWCAENKAEDNKNKKEVFNLTVLT